MSTREDTRQTARGLSLYQASVFWIAIPFFIALHRTLYMAPPSTQMQIAVMVFAFLTILCSWVVMHFATLAIKRALLFRRRELDYDSVVQGFIVLVIASCLVSILLIATRQPRADLFCEFTAVFNSQCYDPLALSWNEQSVRKVLLLSFLNCEYWVLGNFAIALIFGIRRYDFRLTPKAMLAERSKRAAPERPSLLISRLPGALGDNIVSLAANEHYLEVTTDKGSAMVLYRLSDAMRELGDRGTQVHRSYWVAFDAIDRLERNGSKNLVVLKNGSSFPISRSFRHVVRVQYPMALANA